MAVKLTNQLVRIPEGCSIVRANVFEDYDELIISRPIPEERICPSCGSAHCVVKSAMEYHSARHIAISRRRGCGRIPGPPVTAGRGGAARVHL